MNKLTGEWTYQDCSNGKVDVGWITMHYLSQNLIEQLSKLPGIGKKTAQHLAFYIQMDTIEVEKLANAIIDAKGKVHYCSICCNLTDEDPCHICRDHRRDESIICVVEGAKDMVQWKRPGI